MLFSVVRKLFGPGRRPSAGAGRRRAALCLESLEARLVPSASPLRAEGADVKVMTYNLNNGSDLIPLLTAKKAQDVPGAVSQVLAEVKASDIPGRAVALAHVIAAAHPDLIGVQEASVWSVNGVTRYDVLGSLLTALAKAGQHYAVVAKVNAFGGQLPDAQGEIVGLQDQNAILARTDLPPAQFQVSHAQSGFFAAHLNLPIPGAPRPLPALDSWVSVDVKMRGTAFRFVTTHLDSNSPLVNDAQGQELVAALARSKLPVIVAGDFNALANGAGSPTYTDLLHGGLGDAWSKANPHDVGATWGQADPASPGLALNQRIDLVLYHGKFKVDDAVLVGNHQGDMTKAGLWPSDHRGVEVTFDLPAN